MPPFVPALGALKSELDTPALCLDLDAFEANVSRMAAKCQQRNVAWRPHAKCHKSQTIARELVKAGAIGVTCAKLGEAEVIADAGIQDLLIANLIVGERKMQRLVELRRKADPIVCVDHPEHVELLGRTMAAAGLTLRVLIEVDIGLKRVGVPPGEPVLRLAELVLRTPGLQLAGIMGYEGHLLVIDDQNEKAAKIRSAISLLGETKELLEHRGIDCPIVSCGGTGSYLSTLACEGITELQAGGLIFMDAFYRERCRVDEFQFALTVLATVVSRPANDRAIIDAGRKTMNMEITMPRAVGRDDLELVSLSAEHGTLHVKPGGKELRIGDRLEFVPGYSDLTTVLHDRFYCFRGDRLEAIWPMEAHGRVD